VILVWGLLLTTPWTKLSKTNIKIIFARQLEPL
jgi:hypothetical protein